MNKPVVAVNATVDELAEARRMMEEIEGTNSDESVETADEEQEAASEVGTGVTFVSVLSSVTEYCRDLGPQPVLADIIESTVPGEQRFDLRRALTRIFGRRTAIQEGRTGAQLYARSITKQIEAHCESEANGLTLDEREQIIVTLAEGAARELLFAAEALLLYAPAAMAAIRAKADKDVSWLARSRADRTHLGEKFKERLINVCRAIVGEEVNE